MKIMKVFEHIEELLIIGLKLAILEELWGVRDGKTVVIGCGVRLKLSFSNDYDVIISPISKW